MTKVAVDKFKLNLTACSITVIGCMSCLISLAADYSIMIFKLSLFDCNSGTEAANYLVGFSFAAEYRLASSCFGCYSEWDWRNFAIIVTEIIVVIASFG